MKTTIKLLLIGSVLISSCEFIPTEKPCDPEIISDTVVITETIDSTCYPCIDSAEAVSKAKLDAYYIKHRDEFMSLVDSTIEELEDYQGQLAEWNRNLDKKEKTLDSIARMHIKDNVIIYGSPEKGAKVYFDEQTGKPVLEYGN